MFLVDVVLSGLVLGGIYALIAIGLTLQYGVARIMNLAYGEFTIAACFLAYVLFTAAGVNPRAMPPSRPTSRQQSWGSQALPAAFVSSVARSVFSQGKPSRPKWPPAAVLR